MNTSAGPAIEYNFSFSPRESFKVLLDEGPHFFTPFHFHQACQLTLVLEGTGTRLIGERVERFGSGDLVLIGSNLPHVYRNDSQYYEPGAGLRARAISIFFHPRFLSPEFWSQSEMQPLAGWIDDSVRGIAFEGETRRRAGEEIRKLLEMSPGFQRVLLLLDLLYRLSRSTESRFLSQAGAPPTFRRKDSPRLHDVFEFIMNHISGDIRLEEVAELAAMTPSAFSRFFKRQTSKTLTDFVIDIRISEACRQLAETDHSIGEIAFQCGFHNLSNFNRRFKERKGSTPRQYRRQYRH